MPAQPRQPIRTLDDLPEWSTRAQLAEYLQIAYHTLSRWAMEGTGPRVTKFGSLARYRKADVEAYVSAVIKQAS